MSITFFLKLNKIATINFFLVTTLAQLNGRIHVLILFRQLYRKIICFLPHQKTLALRQFLVRQLY